MHGRLLKLQMFRIHFDFSIATFVRQSLLLSLISLRVRAAGELQVESLPDSQVRVRWSVASTNWTLEQADSLASPTTWRGVSDPIIALQDERSITLPPSAAARFFRLRNSGGMILQSSADLINQAQSRGELTEEMATLYQFFAAFKDARLPALYRGDDSAAPEADVFEQIVDKVPTLSDTTRAALLPFFIPPAYAGSWLSPVSGAALKAAARPVFDPNWASVPVSGGHVKVWYDTRDVAGLTQALLCADAVNNRIWPMISGLGILTPLTDADVGDYDGGDGRLDVYLVNLGGQGVVVPDRGLTFSASWARKENPVYLLINKTQSNEELLGTLAHEFMHACQWAYPVNAFSLSSYKWLQESTAQWAIDFVYPQNQLEQRKAKSYCEKPRLSLDVFAGNQDHGYGSYLFFQFLSRSVRPSLIKDIWAATTLNSDQLEAVNKGIPGGFKDQWPKFAKTLWNQDPIRGKAASFTNWDSMMEIPGSRDGSGDLPSGRSELVITLSSDQPNLSTTYYHWTFASAETRSMMFHNTFYENRKNGADINVQALWKDAAGKWTEEDWTELEWIGFCRDQKDQRLSDLVVIVSSAKWQDPGNPIRAATEPEFKRNNVGCWGYQGTASRVTTYSNGTSGKTTASATPRFGFAPSGTASPAGTRLRAFFTGPLFHDGGVAFDERYSEGVCTYSASGSFPLTSVVVGGDSASSIVLNNFLEAYPDDLRVSQENLLGPSERSYTANGLTFRFLTGQVSGRDCGPTYTTTVGLWLLTNATAFEDGGVPPKVLPDGHLQGTFQDSEGSFYKWDLAPIIEP